MTTETLRPNAAGDETSINSQYPDSGEAHWENVDEAVVDDGDTTVYNSENIAYQRDLYNLPASSGSGTINFIKIYFRCRWATEGYAKPSLKSNTTVTDGTEVTLSNTWTTFSQQWNTNPADGGAWEWTDIDTLQIGVSLKAGGSFKAAYCTQVYVEVDYTLATNYERTLSTSIGLAVSLAVQGGYDRSLSTAIGLSATLSRATTYERSLATAIGLVASIGDIERNLTTWLCVASRDGGSVKTRTGSAWSSCAKDASGDLAGAYFAQYDNRLCVIGYQNTGFAYSPVNDITANWTDKPNFPNLPQKFTDMFTGRDAGDDPALYFLTPTGMFYLDVFSNFVFGSTELNWEHDDISGKKGMYWKGAHYIAVGKGIYQVTRGVVDLVGPDMDDGLPENLQGAITDMIGVGFWLVIAIDGGAANKSSILKRYITGNHWHPIYVGSTDTSIRSLFWDSGTLYFGEGDNVKSLPMSNKTENVAKLSTHTYSASGDLIYPYFHSEFEAMPKVAHKVRAVTQDCDSDNKITIYYRIDEATSWTELGNLTSSPRPTALPFPASGDSIGTSFERIQLKRTHTRDSTTTNSPKLESLTLEYRVVPPVLWGWDFRVQAVSSGDQSGQDIIDALKTAIETGTLMSFYPDGDKSGTEYFVEVTQMPGAESGTEFGQEGIYNVSVQEAVD